MENIKLTGLCEMTTNEMQNTNGGNIGPTFAVRFIAYVITYFVTRR